MSRDLFCAIMRPLFTKERMETGIFRFIRCFSRIYKREVRYKADKIGERADPWPTPMLTVNDRDDRSFHR